MEPMGNSLVIPPCASITHALVLGEEKPDAWVRFPLPTLSDDGEVGRQGFSFLFMADPCNPGQPLFQFFLQNSMVSTREECEFVPTTARWSGYYRCLEFQSRLGRRSRISVHVEPTASPAGVAPVVHPLVTILGERMRGW